MAPKQKKRIQEIRMNKNNRQAVASACLEVLKKRYPSPRPHLNAETPWQLLVATVLSAQCTDARVNMVTPALFARWPGPEQLAGAGQEELEECIRSTGFYRNKAKNLISSARMVMRDYNGMVPQTMEDMLRLDGVARKTANVVLWGAFGLNFGLAVDTHVMRIAKRLGLTEEKEQDKIEKDLMALFPREEWGNVNHAMVSFGREVCMARKPDCPVCAMNVFCPKTGVALPAGDAQKRENNEKRRSKKKIT